jgi:ADP-ribosylglycohydrolase
MKASVNSPALTDNLQGMVWGSLVGDAACLGSHWVYDLRELARLFPDGLQGFEPSRQGHYHFGRRPGDQTHYGDGALLMLESIARCGEFSVEDFGARFMAVMGPESYTGYRDHATKETLKNYRQFMANHPGMPFDFQQGADDDQPATVTRLSPLVARHRRDPRLPDLVASAARVCQNNERAVAYALGFAEILRQLLEGVEPEVALTAVASAMADGIAPEKEVAEKIRAALAAQGESVLQATLRFGQSCPLARSFPAALQAVLAYRNDFTGAILATTAAGGDNAARAAMIGACLGAHLGVGAIPESWRTRLTAHDLIEGELKLIAE